MSKSQYPNDFRITVTQEEFNRYCKQLYHYFSIASLCRYLGISPTFLNLEKVNFTQAKLESADFSNINLTGIDFSGAILTRANFNNTIMAGTNLTGAHCFMTNFKQADLTGANFTNATYDGIILTGACMVGLVGIPNATLDTLSQHTGITKPQLIWFDMVEGRIPYDVGYQFTKSLCRFALSLPPSPFRRQCFLSANRCIQAISQLPDEDQPKAFKHDIKQLPEIDTKIPYMMALTHDTSALPTLPMDVMGLIASMLLNTSGNSNMWCTQVLARRQQQIQKSL